MSRLPSLLLVSILLLAERSAASDTLRVAVAANFKPTLEAFVDRYSRTTSVAVDISVGSTGALYAQIRNGAPFHVFFAADAERPALLEKEGYSRRRQAYALGRLVYWQPGAVKVDSDSISAEQVLAIANPRHAPYGTAALTVLSKLNIEPRQLVQGNNVAQAYAFIATGNAPAGFVSLAQVRAKSIATETYWIVPVDLHKPIRQELVVLKNAPAQAEGLVEFVFAASNEMTEAGYLVPGKNPGHRDD